MNADTMTIASLQASLERKATLLMRIERNYDMPGAANTLRADIREIKAQLRALDSVPKTQVKLRFTYEVVTDESAKHGDAERRGWYVDGFECDESDETASEYFELCTAREAIERIAHTVGAIDSISECDGSADIYPADSDTNYQTGDETQYCAHIEGDARLVAAIVSALQPISGRWQAEIALAKVLLSLSTGEIAAYRMYRKLHPRARFADFRRLLTR